MRQLIIRRIREIGIYCEIISHQNLYSNIKKKTPLAIILSGGPASSFNKNSPKLNKEVLKMNIPILGICYGMQLIGKYFGLKLFKKKDVGRHKVYFLQKNNHNQ